MPKPVVMLVDDDGAARHLVERAKFEVEIVTPQVVTRLRVGGSARILTLGHGAEVRCHVALLATHRRRPRRRPGHRDAAVERDDQARRRRRRVV